MLKDAKVRNILHNSLETVMSKRVIACKTEKDTWDALKIQCQGTINIKKNRRADLIQEYEQFEAKSDESLTNTYDIFLTLLDDSSLTERNTNDSSDPDADTDEDFEIQLDDPQVGSEEKKIMIQREDSLTRQSDMFDNIINCKTAKDVWDTIQVICDGTEQVRENKMQLLIQQYEHFHSEEDYKEFTLDRLYGILKTYELEIEQDEKMKKGRKKGGSIALVAEQEKEKEIKVEAVESTPNLRVCEGKGKGLVTEHEDQLSQDDTDDIDGHLAFLSRRFSKLKFKKNFGAAKSNRNMVDKSKFRCFKCGLEGHFSSECRKPDSAWKKNKGKLDSNLFERDSTDVDSTDDENYPSNNQKDFPSKDNEPHLLSASEPVGKAKLPKLNEKYGSVFKNFVPGEISQIKKNKRVNVGHLSIKQLNGRLEKI
ncbi:hypothetical protein AgCh_009193 [Apium graveolens]